MKSIVLAVALLLMFSGPALASLTPYFVGPVTATGSNFTFNYGVVLPGNERLDLAATNGMTCRGPSSTSIQCNPTGTFFTIYDIPGFVSASTSAPGWSFTTQLVGVTPSNVNSSFDSASLVNVTFTYTSSTVVHANGTDLTITGFQIVSSLGGINGAGHYSSQDSLDVGGASGSTLQGVGSVSVPNLVIGLFPGKSRNDLGALTQSIVALPIAPVAELNEEWMRATEPLRLKRAAMPGRV